MFPRAWLPRNAVMFGLGLHYRRVRIIEKDDMRLGRKRGSLEECWQSIISPAYFP
jgi:hypothetical protein